SWGSTGGVGGSGQRGQGACAEYAQEEGASEERRGEAARGQSDGLGLSTNITMSSFEEADTEETITCLQMMMYHPCQAEKQVFRGLKFYKRERFRVDELVKFGRDVSICHYNLMDSKVSRIQFTLHFFQHFTNLELCFEIKNMSKKTKLIVDNVELGYLNKMELPCKCIIRFGDYQILMMKERGQSVDNFETFFELSQVSLLQETHVSSLVPIPEYGIPGPFPAFSIAPTPHCLAA
uniref:TRAF-interacting protein with FHA domain-containing protein A n=1 Tax=Sphenodon punctatus TaxID=8508 RepID=A0A8D0HEL1_SPHPU